MQQETEYNLKTEKPAQGILRQGDLGDAKFYYIQCDCGSETCAHTIEIEADVEHVQVHIYHTVTTRWWQKSRWKYIWNLLTRGYAEMQTTTVLDEQTAINYASTLTEAVKDVKVFRKENSLLLRKRNES